MFQNKLYRRLFLQFGLQLLVSVAINLLDRALGGGMLVFFLVLANTVVYFLFCLANTFPAHIISGRSLAWLTGLGFSCLVTAIFTGAFLEAETRFAITVIAYFFAGIYCALGSGRKIPLPLIFIFMTGVYLMLIAGARADIIFLPLLLAAPLSFAGVVWVVKSRIRIAPFFSFIILAGILSYIGYPNFSNYVTMNAVAGGSELSKVPFTTNTGDTLTAGSLNAKVIVLDIWYSQCGVCFQKFPETEAIYRFYEPDKTVYVAAVNVPMDRDSNNDAWNLIPQYHFPKMRTVAGIESNPWRVTGYPTILVFDKNKHLRYAGTMEIKNRLVVNNIFNIIARLKDE